MQQSQQSAEKRILIATGGSATAEMAMKYSSFSLWLQGVAAFMDESQQYGNCHEIAALGHPAPALIVFVGDHTVGKHLGAYPKEERQQMGRSSSTVSRTAP